MKRFLMTAAVTVATLATPALAANVGVSLSVGDPGFYGRIDIGDYPYPQPRVIYRQPRAVERVEIARAPIYMRVPPGHARNWRKHCGSYNACGERVYFVQDDWYSRDYAPHYREQHRRHGGDDRDDRREDHRDDRHGDNHHGDDHNHR